MLNNMSKKHKFDQIMDLVEDSCKLKFSDFKKTLYNKTGYNDMEINKTVVVLTNGKKTLQQYFRERKLFHATQELVFDSEKPIVDIALEYGYSDQTAFSRAIKNMYGKTPKDIQTKAIQIPDDKLSYVGKENRLANILKSFEGNNVTFVNDIQRDYFEEFIRATNEYGFDESACCAISEVAERLEMPFGFLLQKCFEAYIDYKIDEAEYGGLTPKMEAAIDLGISNGTDIKKICAENECEWYELTQSMVDKYYGYDVQEKLKESIIPV